MNQTPVSAPSRSTGTPGRKTSSSILRRILAINILALAILVAGLLYLGEYRQELIDSELAAQRVHAEMLAAALGESATADDVSSRRLHPNSATQMVRRLVSATGGRARLFTTDGKLIADSRELSNDGIVQKMVLPLPDEIREDAFTDKAIHVLLDTFERFIKLLPGSGPRFDRESLYHKSTDYEALTSALYGEHREDVRMDLDGHLNLITAVPVQRYKKILGALVLTRDGEGIEESIRQIRIDIIKVFAIALAITVLLSLYLASTIARPIKVLANAAEKVRHGHHRQHAIPNFDKRDDEIGELSLSLRDMTEALWLRMDAIESFAADVSHEIKNPLTSLRSAVETAARIQDPDQQQKLMDIILDDVNRLDRLISDISDASRLDAELSRAETGSVNLDALLSSLIEARRTTSDIQIDYETNGDLNVIGIESRLGQVFANLLTNAISFSPPDGLLKVKGQGETRAIFITIEDDGPGIPAGKEKDIFERFYTERPEGEKFGTHSGLGLSISRQVIEAHDGRITAENRLDDNGDVMGARFIVSIPRQG